MPLFRPAEMKLLCCKTIHIVTIITLVDHFLSLALSYDSPAHCIRLNDLLSDTNKSKSKKVLCSVREI